MILFSNHLVPKGYTGITIYPFFFLKIRNLKNDVVLINHEKIHLRQQVELLVIPFYIIYLLEFIIRLIQYRKWYLAYRNISFEREAYRNENDLNYLKSRPFWNYIKYL
jgi:hypothetical protein